MLMFRSLILWLPIVLLVFGIGNALGAGEWDGHDFAFCFVTDDGTKSNLAWADTARVMDFRFTIAVNVNSETPSWHKLTWNEINQLWADGFEIAQHGGSHANDGLTDTCASPPKGSWMGYFLCPDPDEASRMASLMADISRDTIATWTGVPISDIRVVAYPRHRHGMALIDSLISEGFIGARTGGKWDFESNSFGDFTTVAPNSWDGGISLFRLPIANSETYLFGNHSADPPVHRTYEEFRSIAEQVITPFRDSGGICVVYTHHLGNDDDSMGDINYSSGGITVEELAWLVDFVREKNGKIMTFGDAVAYYRERSHVEDIEGDMVWKPGVASANVPPVRVVENLLVHPNPFNPVTRLEFNLTETKHVTIRIYDLRGRLVKELADANLAAGHHFFDWTGLDTQGRRLGSGTYLVHLKAGTDIQFRRVSLIK